MNARAVGQPQVSSILCVHQGFELYGSDRSFLQAIKAIKLCQPQARITAVIPEPGPLEERLHGLVDELVIRELAVLRRGELKKRFLSFAGKLPGRVRQAHADCRDHDLVYINTLVILDFILASWWPGRRMFVHVRENPGRMLRIVLSLLLAPSRAVLIFNSCFTRRSFSWLKWKDAHVIHNVAEDYRSIKSLAVNGERLKLLLLGRFNAMKGQALLLEAVAGMTERERRRLEIRIVGSAFRDQDCHEKRIRQRIIRLGLESQVRVMAFNAYPEQMLEWAEVVVIPSTRPESFGRTAIEAMSAGRCVLAADHGGLLEIVTSGVDGILFKANDVQSLQRAIRDLLNDRQKVVDLGKSGRARYLRSFTECCHAQQFAMLLAPD